MLLFLLLSLINSKKRPKIFEKARANPKCTVCKTILDMIKTFLTDKGKWDNAIDVVKPLCKYFKGETGEACTELVTNHIPTVLRLLDSQISPIEVCHVIRFCDKKETEEDDDDYN